MKKILIVDDDKELCEEIAESLVLEGYQVKCVFDGKGGKETIQKEDFDLVILDLKLPGIGGYELLKQVKGTKPSEKAIILTGSFLVKYIEKNSENYTPEQRDIARLADDIIDKPFDMEKMIVKINKMLS